MLPELFCAVLVFCLTRVLWRRWKYDLHKIPSPSSWPLIGHTLEFTRGQAGKQLPLWMRRQLQSLGFPKVMRLEIAGQTTIVVTDVDYVHSAVLTKPSAFPRHVIFRRMLLPFLGNKENIKSLTLTQNITPYTKAIRKLYAVAMQSSQLKRAMPKLNGVMQRLIDIIESRRQDGAVDFQTLGVQFTMDTIGVVALDTNLGGLDGSRQIQKMIIETGHVARANVTNPFISFYCKLLPNSAVAQKQRETINEMTNVWDVLTKEIMQKDDPPEGETPLWYELKMLIDPDTGKPLDYETLRAELATIVGAGMDTTGHQLGWIMAMLATHPRIVEKLLEELKERGLCGPNARDVTFEDLGELKYLAAVIKEGMRIAHIGGLSYSRTLAKDMTLLGYHIPKGTDIMAPSNRSLYSKTDWGDPEVVRPERWLPDDDLSRKCFKVFSTGPRDCVGQKLAMMEIRFAIVKLVTKYKLSMDVSFDALLENTVEGMVIEAKDGIWIKVSPREAPNPQST